MKTRQISLLHLFYKQMLSKSILTISFLIFCAMSFAQLPQLKLWTLPPNQIAFTPALGTSLLNASSAGGYFGLTPTYASNSMHDASGNLLFYIVDNIVYDKDGFEIDQLKISNIPLSITGTTVSDPALMGQEISIVPRPGSCTQYYIITAATDNQGTRWEPVYTLIDMSLQNINFLTPLDPSKKGALQYFTTGTNVFDIRTISPPLAFGNLAGPYTEKFRFGMAITPFRTGTNNYFLYLRGFSKNLYRFIVDATGITFDNSATDGGIIDVDPMDVILSGADGGSNDAYPEMEIVASATGDYQLAYVFAKRDIVLVKLNNNGTLATSGVTTFTAPGVNQIRGVEFSPNGNYIYYSYYTLSSGVSHIGFSNTTTLAPTEMLNTSYSGANTLGNSFIELGYDGKLYYNDGNKLLSLTNPDSGPFPANWTSTALVFSSPSSQTLPDQLDGNIYTGAGAGSIVTTFTATTSSLFPTTTQIWTPTNNPFGGTLVPLNPVGTLSNPIVILDKLIIPSNFNITIQGMRFEFAGRTYDPITPTLPIVAGASVQVLRSTTAVKGGRLTLDNSTFTHTNSCRTGMWEGIEVHGSNAASQGSYTVGKQGWLIVKNNSIVENSYHAVVMARVTNTFNGVPGFGSVPAVDLSHSGGVVQVTTNSRFRNNYIDVYFGNYDFVSTSIDNNLSSFDNCIFETTPTTTTTPITTTIFDMDANLNLVNWFHHVLIGVKGVMYNGVTFQNTDPTNIEYDILLNKRGTGIFSLNSYFNVARRFFPPFNRGNFNNLTYGVYAANFGSTKTFNISECNFNDNYRGVYVGSVNYEKITLCNFTVNRWPMSPPVPTSNDAAYGIYLNFSKGFRVEENDFTYATGSISPANSFGVIVNQSNINRNCGQHDEIYKNNFHDILAGGRAQGNNSERDYNPTLGMNVNCYSTAPFKKNYIGLEFLCNSFTSNVDNSDLSVTRSQNLATAGNIAYIQGDFSSSTLTPAGNTFSHTSASTWDFYSQLFSADVNGTIVYVHHNSDPLRTPNTVVLPPINTAPCLGCGTYTTAASCPSKMGPRSTSILRQEIVSFENQAASLETQIDGGNTSYLLSQIYGTMSAGSLKNLLMSKSPLLSDRVLIAYITKAGVPSGNLKQVVIANSPLSQPVMEELNAISLPNGIRNQINAAQTGVSARTKLESEVSYYSSQRAFNIDELIRVFSNDTLLDNGVDSILTVFKTYNVEQNSTDITLAYLTKGNIPKATLLNDSLKTAGVEETFTKMMDVAIALKQAAQQESNLLTDVALKTKVDELSVLNDAKESPSASAVLKLLFNFIYNEYIEPVSWEATYHSMFQMVSAEEDETTTTNLYPNPSNGVSNFSYSLQEGERGELQIFDIAGKLIQSYQLAQDNNVININNTELNAGTYMYKYVVNGSVTNTDKLVIIK